MNEHHQIMTQKARLREDFGCSSIYNSAHTNAAKLKLQLFLALSGRGHIDIDGCFGKTWVAFTRALNTTWNVQEMFLERLACENTNVRKIHSGLLEEFPPSPRVKSSQRQWVRQCVNMSADILEHLHTPCEWAHVSWLWFVFLADL